MRKGFSGGLIAGTMVLALSACGEKEGGGGASLEKGQVVATVNGKDVTIHELNAELQGVQMPAGERRKLVEQAALQQIVNRRIVADQARERGIDKTPMFLLQQRRAEDGLLVQMLQRQLASTIRQPTRDEANKFMTDNPELFAQRKIYTLDQIQFEPPQDMKRLASYQPLKTMDEVEAKLNEDGLRYRRAPAQIDAVQVPPQLLQQIQRLPAGEVFIIPNGQALVANRITEATVVPFSGDQATNFAMQQIQQKKLGELATKELDAKVKKSRDEVKYQPGFAPPKPPTAPGAAPAPSAAPAPAAK